MSRCTGCSCCLTPSNNEVQLQAKINELQAQLDKYKERNYENPVDHLDRCYSENCKTCYEIMEGASQPDKPKYFITDVGRAKRYQEVADLLNLWAKEPGDYDERVMALLEESSIYGRNEQK